MQLIQTKRQLLVVGNGMASVACVEQFLKHGHDFEITIFRDETHVNYNRIMLSSVLAGEKSADDIVLNDVLNDISWYRSNNIRARLGVRIAEADTAKRVMIDSEGVATPFDKLIFATSSSAFVPKIALLDRPRHTQFIEIRPMEMSPYAAPAYTNAMDTHYRS